MTFLAHWVRSEFSQRKVVSLKSTWAKTVDRE